MPYSIMLDAGHGGRDPGAVYNGRQEKDDTLALTLAVGEILQNNGIDVEYTRVDFFVSIHRNSFPTDNEVSGVETLVYDLSGLKYQVAQDIAQQLEAVGFVNLGVKARPGLVVLRRTAMPAVLVEAGFLNSDVDNQLFDDHFQDIAQAIARGILDGLSAGGALEGGEAPEYRIQTGLFRNWTYARRMENELLEEGFPAFVDDTGQYLSVQVGPYQTLVQAAEEEQKLRSAGYQTLIIR